MGGYLRRILTAFATLVLVLVFLSACMAPEKMGESGTTVTTTTTTVTTTTSPPSEPPVQPDDGFDDEGFENRPEDDETKRY